MSSKSGSTASTDILGPEVHTASKRALPLVLGLVYGCWAAADRRDGGPFTGWNLPFGFVTRSRSWPCTSPYAPSPRV
jgi:hypothetical protein